MTKTNARINNTKSIKKIRRIKLAKKLSTGNKRRIEMKSGTKDNNMTKKKVC